MKRHAFLIIAHNEFGILQRLVSSLDNVRVDFFIHIDAKVRDMPNLTSTHSRIVFVEHRIDTRWGDYSQIETEMSLFLEAIKYPEYSFYHIISGVHYPLVSVESLLDYYDSYTGKNVMTGLCQSSLFQERLKLRHYNLFTRNFSHGSALVKMITQRLWRLSDTIQHSLNLWRNSDVVFFKAANWVSLSYEGLKYIVEHKKVIHSIFAHTFCGDEYFVPTILHSSPLESTIIDDNRLLMQIMGDSSPKVLTSSDFQAIMDSGCMFARKFSEIDTNVLDMIERQRS